MTTLTNEEKVVIINQHLKNLNYSKFNIEISLIEENAKSVKDAEQIASLNEQAVDIDLRITALEDKIEELS
jgi:hypothetical protein